MKSSEFRNKSVEELQQTLHGELEKQFKLRMQRATGQLTQTHLMKASRHNVARIKTLLTEKAGN